MMGVSWGLLFLLLQLCMNASLASVLNSLWQRGSGDNTKRSNVKVSFRECNLDNGEKHNCGYFGISAEECASRECCWREVDTEGVPWCYHSKPTIRKACMVVTDTRVECGSYGIRKETCLNKGCCWQPSNDPSAPWCYHQQRLPIFTGECGVPATAPAVNTKIVGGTEAVPGSWPWQVSLQTGGRHFCGGSLINEQWVVSAAHCAVMGIPTIALGMHSKGSRGPHQVSIKVEEVIVHEEYEKAAAFDSDIMLLKLSEPVTFSDTISPVCLPTLGQEYEPGLMVYTTGWGTTSSGGEAPDVLQQVGVPVVAPDTCAQWYWESERPANITDTMLCAGYQEGGRDSCQGDSGGPLVRYEGDHWTLAGVVSWGYGCAYEVLPGVYCRTAQFRDWIEHTITEYSKK